MYTIQTRAGRSGVRTGSPVQAERFLHKLSQVLDAVWVVDIDIEQHFGVGWFALLIDEDTYLVWDTAQIQGRRSGHGVDYG